MNEANWHQYQVLTKRAERVEELSPYLQWAPHIWMGVSVESAKYLYRIDHLRKTGAYVKFLSLESRCNSANLAELHSRDPGGR